MSLKTFTSIFALLALLCGPISAAEPSRPNILLILADDLGYGDLSCYGATKVSTPNIDRLAKEGMRFTDAHSPSAVCSPTRYALLTGQYAFRHPRLKQNVLHANDPLVIAPGKATLASQLKGAGYATACVGKWHLGMGETKPDWNGELKPGPLEVGFDYYFGVPTVNSEQPNVFVENHRIVGLDPADPITELQNLKMTGGNAARYEHGHIDDRHAEKAIAWLEKQTADKTKPFFLYFATCSIHTPMIANPKFKGRSQVGPRGDFLLEHDWVVGQVLDALDRLGVADNTLVIYSSDNGGLDSGIFKGKGTFEEFGHKPNGDWRGMKSDIWEAGHRVPFLVRWPGKTPPGTTSDQLICLTDLFITLHAITGIPKPEGTYNSVNFASVFQGKAPAKPLRSHLVHQSIQGLLALREGDWKYIPAQGSGGITSGKGNYMGKATPDPAQPPGQLYNLRTDPCETKNLHAEHPDIVARMAQKLEGIRNAK